MVGYSRRLVGVEPAEALFGKMGPFDHLVYTAGDSMWQRAIGEIKLNYADYPPRYRGLQEPRSQT